MSLDIRRIEEISEEIEDIGKDLLEQNSLKIKKLNDNISMFDWYSSSKEKIEMRLQHGNHKDKPLKDVPTHYLKNILKRLSLLARHQELTNEQILLKIYCLDVLKNRVEEISMETEVALLEAQIVLSSILPAGVPDSCSTKTNEE